MRAIHDDDSIVSVFINVRTPTQSRAEEVGSWIRPANALVAAIPDVRLISAVTGAVFTAPIFPAWNGNSPLMPNPPLAPDSTAMVNVLYANPNGQTLTGPGLNDAQSSFYDSTESDPAHTVYCHYRWGPTSNGHRCLMDGTVIHIPANALSGTNTDKHVSVLSPDGCTLNDFWQLPWDGGVHDKNYHLDSDAIDNPDNPSILTAGMGSPYNQCTGSGFSPVAGGATQGGGSNRLGRAPVSELQTGTIHHALEVAIACNTVLMSVGQSRSYLVPRPDMKDIPGKGNACSTTTGPYIPYGAYVWSDISPAALPAGLDTFTRMICTAMYVYGAVVDTTIGPYNGMSLNTGWSKSDPAYATWITANTPASGPWAQRSDPMACFPGGRWQDHIHVLDWTKVTRQNGS